MGAAHPSLVYDAAFEEVRERSGADRRKGNRRAAGLTLDPLFAATLVNHVAAPERAVFNGYSAPQNLRAGIAFDVRA